MVDAVICHVSGLSLHGIGQATSYRRVELPGLGRTVRGMGWHSKGSLSGLEPQIILQCICVVFHRGLMRKYSLHRRMTHGDRIGHTALALATVVTRLSPLDPQSTPFLGGGNRTERCVCMGGLEHELIAVGSRG